MKRAFRATATGVALTITGGVVVALAVFGVFGAHAFCHSRQQQAISRRQLDAVAPTAMTLEQPAERADHL